jgi:predicted RND superfamily exporter protein
MHRFFRFVTDHPRGTLVAVAVVVLPLAAFVARIEFDHQPDSFIPPGHEALESKKKVEEIFGLEDPMLIAVIALDDGGRPQPDGLYSERPLRVIQSLSERIVQHLSATYGDPGAHPVYSLATEYDIEMVGGLEPMERPFLEPFPATPREFERLKEAVGRLELYDGVLVSDNGAAGAIVVVPPPGHAQEVYEFIARLVESSREPGIRLALAGEAAVRAAMGTAVLTSALRLNPVSLLIVIFFLVLAFRNAAGVLLPLLVVGAGSAFMLGLMCLMRVPVYIITTAILVTVLSLGVADAIHVLGEYYRELGRGGWASRQELVVRANERLWVPVLYTSVTDMAGFLSFFVSGIMPPLKWFGFFTAVGVGATLLASFTLLPAALMYLDPGRRSHERLRQWAASGLLARGLSGLAASILRRPRSWLAGGALTLAITVAYALRLEPDQSMVSTFDSSSEIVRADRIINELFDGTYFLDVLIEAEQPGDLLEPGALRRIADLEEYASGLEHVEGSISVAGFARKVNQIFNNWDPDSYRIPADAETVRDQFARVKPGPDWKGSPSKYAELMRLVDRHYRFANVRLRLSTGRYREERRVVEAVQAYVAEHFPPGGWPRATLSGRVNLDYHWMRLILDSHLFSVALTLGIIFVFLVILFRSLASGLLCLLPVGFGVLVTYAVMGAAGIPLSIGTAMFASLAIGVGVNFPIHLLDRLRVTLEKEGLSLEDAYRETFSLTGKALFFNAMAVSCGFLASLASDLPLLRHFGMMIALAISSCCVASLTLLPAAVALRERRRAGKPPGRSFPGGEGSCRSPPLEP